MRMPPTPGPTAQFCGYQEKSSDSQAQERRNRLSRLQQLRIVERDHVREKCDLYQNVIDERKGIRECEAKNHKRVILQQQYAELVDEWKRSLINNGKAMKEAKETAVITQKRLHQKEYSHRIIAQHAKERNNTAAAELSKDRIPFENEEQRKIQYRLALRDMAKVHKENVRQTAESKQAKEAEIEKQKQHDYFAHGKVIRHQVGAEQSGLSILDRGPVVVHALIQRHHLPSVPIINSTKLVYNAELEEDVSHRRLWKRVMSELTGKKKAKVRSKAAVKVRIQHKQVDHMEDELMMLHNVDRIGSRSNRAKSADVVAPDVQPPVLLTAFERIFLLNQNVDTVTKGSDAMSATTISSTPKHVALPTPAIKNKSKEISPTPKRSSSPKVVMKSNNWTVIDDLSSFDEEETNVAIENVLNAAPKWQTAVETSRSSKVVGKETSTSLKSSIDTKKLQILAPSWSAVAASGYGIEPDDPVDDVEMPRGALPRPFNKEDVWRNLPIEEAVIERNVIPKASVIDWYDNDDDDNNEFDDGDDDSLKVDEKNYKQYFPYDERSVHSPDVQKSFYEVHVPTIPITESVSPKVLSPQSSYKGESIQKEHHNLTPLLISTAIDNIDEIGEVNGSWLTDDNMSHRSYIEGDDDDIASHGLSSDASTDVARHDNQTFFNDTKSELSNGNPPPYSVADSYDRYASTESDVDYNNQDDSDEEEILTPKPSPGSSPYAINISRFQSVSVTRDLIDVEVASVSKESTSSSTNSIPLTIQDSTSVNQSIQSEKTPFKEVAIDVLTGLADRSYEVSPNPALTEYSGLTASDSSILSTSMKSGNENAMTPMREAAVNTLTDLMNAPYETSRSRSSSTRSSPLHESNMSRGANVNMRSPISADVVPGLSPMRQLAINSLTDLMNAPYETSRNSTRSSPAKSPLQVSIMSSGSIKSRSPSRDVPVELTPMKLEAINTLTDLMNAPYESSRSILSKSPLSTLSQSYQSSSTNPMKSPMTNDLDITPTRQNAINTLTDLMNAPYESNRSTPTSRISSSYLSPSKSPLSNISYSYLSNDTLTNSPPIHESSVHQLLNIKTSTDSANSPRMLSTSRVDATVSLMSNDSSFDESSSDHSSSMGSDGSPVRQQQDRMVHDSLNSSYHSVVTSSTKDRSLKEADLSRSRLSNSVSQSLHSKIIDVDSALQEINAELMNQSIVVESKASSVSSKTIAERIIPSSPSAASSISSYSAYDKYTEHVNSAMFESPSRDVSSPKRLQSNIYIDYTTVDDHDMRLPTRVQPPDPFKDVVDERSTVEINVEGVDYGDDRSESTVDDLPFSLLEVRAVSGTKVQSPIKIFNSTTSSASGRITLDHLLGNEGISSSNSNSALDLSFASSSSSAHSSYMPLNASNLALAGQIPKLSSPAGHNNRQYDAARVRIREEIAGLKSHLINVVGNNNAKVNVSTDSDSSSDVSLGTLTKKHPFLNTFPTPDALEYNSELNAPVNSPMGLRRTLGVNYLLSSEIDDHYDLIDEDSLVISDVSSSRIQNSNAKAIGTPLETMGNTYDLTPMSILSEGSLQQHLIQLSRRSNDNNSASKYSILSGGNLSEGYTPNADRFNPVASHASPALFNLHATGGTQTSLSSGSIDSQDIVHDSLDDDDDDDEESYRL